ncbi:hypothetical protein BDK51DRAFT_51158 [Blyttiomyces helicus]|uniref:Uncharacterized protein n=1 Tax=Blyttiomyces helicus TaxID=388810 RepID=A0A4P9WQE7_9FUNG|nr:hypothetical protein BDK51DRAFT_51158 [Blyttiomyces helicus]|eukprot:RKO94822.1 hypothetical protein BDK51DRAFT_51158 [Blyttiomyces helicus]
MSSINPQELNLGQHRDRLHSLNLAIHAENQINMDRDSAASTVSFSFLVSLQKKNQMGTSKPGGTTEGEDVEDPIAKGGCDGEGANLWVGMEHGEDSFKDRDCEGDAEALVVGINGVDDAHQGGARGVGALPTLPPKSHDGGYVSPKNDPQNYRDQITELKRPDNTYPHNLLGPLPQPSKQHDDGRHCKKDAQRHEPCQQEQRCLKLRDLLDLLQDLLGLCIGA